MFAVGNTESGESPPVGAGCLGERVCGHVTHANAHSILLRSIAMRTQPGAPGEPLSLRLRHTDSTCAVITGRGEAW